RVRWWGRWSWRWSCCGSFRAAVAGELEEDVLEAAAQGGDVVGDDVVPGELEDDGGQHGPGAGHLDLPAALDDVGDLRQGADGGQVDRSWSGHPERPPVGGGLGQLRGGTLGDHPTGVDDDDPVAEVLGLVHEVGDEQDGHPAPTDLVDERPGLAAGL